MGKGDKGLGFNCKSYGSLWKILRRGGTLSNLTNNQDRAI